MNVVDSSAWLEYFADGPNAKFFSEPIEDSEALLVPTVSIYEVFKRMLQQKGETDAIRAIAFMRSGQVVELTATIAMHAADISNSLRIPMADSMILATAREFSAIVWTQDQDFEGLEDVKYYPSQ